MGLVMLARLLPRLGWKGMLLVAVAVAVFWALGGGGLFSGAPVGTGPTPTGTDDPAAFVSFVLDDTQATWERVFTERGARYEPAELVLFSKGTQSACGYGASEVGPFYCPADRRVYIDLSFYDDLARRYGAPGDFAEAYVIAHEIGHHVQRLRGELAGTPARGATNVSVAMELQADCYAGVWARSAADRGLVEPGDLEEGIRAASAVGDDRLQEAQTGRVRPETFTHGTAEQRSGWFRRGYEAGTPEACNTSGGS